MSERIDEGQELTGRAWEVLARGYGRVVAAAKIMLTLRRQESAAIDEFYRLISSLPEATTMSVSEQAFDTYHAAYDHIQEAGGALVLRNIVMRARYSRLCKECHDEVDKLLAGHMVRATAPNRGHSGFIATDTHGMMRGTKYDEVRGLYLCSDLPNGGMYLLAGLNGEQCHVYVPLFTGGDESRRMSDFVVEPPPA